MKFNNFFSIVLVSIILNNCHSNTSVNLSDTSVKYTDSAFKKGYTIIDVKSQLKGIYTFFEKSFSINKMESLLDTTKTKYLHLKGTGIDYFSILDLYFADAKTINILINNENFRIGESTNTQSPEIWEYSVKSSNRIVIIYYFNYDHKIRCKELLRCYK